MRQKFLIVLLVINILGNSYFFINIKQQNDQYRMLWEVEFQQYMGDLIDYVENLKLLNSNVINIYNKSLMRQGARAVYFSNNKTENISNNLAILANILNEKIDVTNEENIESIIKSLENIIFEYNELISRDILFNQLLERMNHILIETIEEKL
ncbi:hypothetical protein AWH56_003975 [Anaerobacillus isosaccharinicus]|uniref:Uncharacterized protein n=1 Tax=Anaerobacillus isosaccharinicus TaxID=1532552 RepID=A0A1S2KW10_9BACI|nr:hypothetical protein [Anaerobacillus isosaccharinicus]MBA5584815.1 hypothetical protein [Anaerobacillus isosaccharinicus]QOY36820.1 hypothetical protein AWH56_003975 [Anaerobacillus isosaccharinicus]